MRRRLEVIDLAGDEGVHRGLMVGDPLPLDAVHLHDLAAGQRRRRVGARLVLVELRVDGLVARLPLLLAEHERSRAREVGDLRVGIGLGHALGHHERDVRGRLAERAEHEARRLVDHDLERPGTDDLDVLDERHQLLAHRVFGRPALDRGDAVLGGDGLAVVPHEAVAQRERVRELVLADLVLVHHLRLDLALGVHGEERVVDHVAVIAHDVGGRPDRIDDLEIRVQDHAQRRLGADGRDARERGERGGDRDESSKCHGLLPGAEHITARV